MSTYLDWVSAAPVSKNAERAFMRALQAYGNPSSPHAEGMRAEQILEESRQTIARLVGVKPAGVIFTSGATEANNLAIQGHVTHLLDSGRNPQDIHLLYLPTSHSSVVETMQSLEKKGIKIEPISLTDGQINFTEFKKQIRPETVLVSMDVVCGETGVIWNTREVRRVLDSVRISPKILLHADASQAAFVESLEMNHLGANLMTLDAQKVGGVRGIGVLIRTQQLIHLAPIMYGGGQEQGLRPGTENPALASAFSVALEEVQRKEKRQEFVGRSRRLRTQLLAQLSVEFPDMIVNTNPLPKSKEENVASNIVNISFPKIDTDYTVMLLSKAGYAVSTKSACETDSAGSRVVLTLTGNAEQALSTLRISWGPTTSSRSLTTFLKQLIKTIAFQKTS